MTTINEKIAPKIEVDRGQPVVIEITFGDGDPDEVHFLYLRPGEGRPYADEGFGQEGSRIHRLAEGTYVCAIDTTGFQAGGGWWHFFGRWHSTHAGRPYDRASKFGEFSVRATPEQLL